MKLEQQVCTLEQAKQLKELGIIQISLYHYLHLPDMIYRKESWHIADGKCMESMTDKGESFSAFTVAELGVMLPDRLHTPADNEDHWFNCCKHAYEEGDVFWESNFKKSSPAFSSCLILREHLPTEAESKADMLIFLLKNNHITAAEVNNRLQQ